MFFLVFAILILTTAILLDVKCELDATSLYFGLGSIFALSLATFFAIALK